jgi:site-specific DNA-methyltransferase (adenine-specific)
VASSVRIGRGQLLRGDCLQVLSELDSGFASDFAGGFDLAYMDPPFNAGGERGARLKKGERVSGKLAYKDGWGGLDAFLTMLEPRIVAVRDALSPIGSLWLHLDHRAVHDAKVVSDRVFGRAAFQGEVIWVPGNGGKRRAGPSVTHQTILIFARGREMIWNGDDPALRERHAQTSLRMHFKNVDADGRNYRDRHVAGKTYRYYADLGRRIGSVWSDCPSMRANTPLIKEATGYPTQKPESLLERILRAATLENSLVLDPMHGSGTTLAVAERLSRRWLGIDQSPLAHRIAKLRLRNLCSLPSQA